MIYKLRVIYSRLNDIKSYVTDLNLYDKQLLVQYHELVGMLNAISTITDDLNDKSFVLFCKLQKGTLE